MYIQNMRVQAKNIRFRHSGALIFSLFSFEPPEAYFRTLDLEKSVVRQGLRENVSPPDAESKNTQWILKDFPALATFDN